MDGELQLCQTCQHFLRDGQVHGRCGAWRMVDMRADLPTTTGFILDDLPRRCSHRRTVH